MIRNIKYLGISAILLIGFITSCSNSVDLPGVDNSGIDKAANTYVALKNYNDPRPAQVVELRTGGGTAQVALQLSKVLTTDLTGTLKYDAAVVDSFNAAHGTTYAAFPVDEASLASTTVTVKAGETQSAPVNITLNSGASLVVGTTYILPISVNPNSADVKTSAGEGSYVFLVKYMGNIPNAAKASGIKTIFYYDGQDIRNGASYTLKGTPGGVDDGKPVADIVIIFSANINFNALTGKVYVSLNPQVSAFLNNRDKYIKPLQDMGIKVVLSILGNHDKSGLANLGTAASKDFAQQLKTITDTYNLDGVLFDDEYSNYTYPVPTGFTSPSGTTFANLIYNTKMAAPDKLMLVYQYGYGYSLPKNITDNTGATQPIANYIDGMMGDPYYSNYIDNSAYASMGIPYAKIAPYCVSAAYSLSPSSTTLGQVRSGGYGFFGIFSMPAGYAPYTNGMTTVARALYDGSAVFNGNTYADDAYKQP